MDRSAFVNFEPDRFRNLYQIAHSGRRWKSGITADGAATGATDSANMPRRISTFATLQHAGRDKAAKRLIVTLVSFAMQNTPDFSISRFPWGSLPAHSLPYLPLDPGDRFARSEGLKERWGSLRRIEAAMEPKGWLTGLIHRARSRYFRYTSDRIGAANVEWGQQRNWKVVDPTVLIPGILSKIRPRNCPNQSYVHRITDSGPAPGVGG